MEGTPPLAELTADSWLLVKEGISSRVGTEALASSSAAEADRSKIDAGRDQFSDSGCVARPPILWMPQKGRSSRREGLAVGNESPDLVCWSLLSASAHNEKVPYELPVLYPSGTDLRTRMPTLRRLDWMFAGRGGEIAAAAAEGCSGLAPSLEPLSVK
jgi:hypothetical protein